MSNRYPFKLALITNRHLVKSKPLIRVVEEALAGGVDAVILREPDLSPKALLMVAREFRKLTRDYNAKLIVKDRVDIAIIVEADGVQLGSDSILPGDARKIWNGLIGYSAHSEKEIHEYSKQVDYFILSPLFRTDSKPFLKPIGVEKFTGIVNSVDKPIYPLGGINLESARILREVGVEVAVCMSIFYRLDSAKLVAMKLRELLGGKYDSN